MHEHDFPRLTSVHISIEMQRFHRYFEHLFTQTNENPGELFGMIEHALVDLNVALDVQRNRMKELLVTRHVSRRHRLTRMIDVIFHVFLLNEFGLCVRTAFLQLSKDVRFGFDLVSTKVVHAACHLDVTLVAMLVRVGARWFDRGHHRSNTLLKQSIDWYASTFECFQGRGEFIADGVHDRVQRFLEDEPSQFTGDVDVIELSDVFLHVEQHFVLLVFQGARTTFSGLEQTHTSARRSIRDEDIEQTSSVMVFFSKVNWH